MTSAATSRHGSGQRTDGGGGRGFGLLMFAVVVVVMVGFFNMLDGITAIAHSHIFVNNAHYVIGNLRAWGWIVTILGILELAAGSLLITGSQITRWFAVVVVGINAIAQMFFLVSYPFWSILIISVDLVALYGLTMYGARDQVRAMTTDGRSSGCARPRCHGRQQEEKMTGNQLPSWRETPARQSVANFVAAVTDQDSADFVPEADRIAVFDNDGTLWTEQPFYAQLGFAIDRAADLGHPTSLEKLHAGGLAALTELLTLTHSGITTDEFGALSRSWLATARHPRFGRPYHRRCTSRCWNCSACWIATAFPAGSSPAGAPTSCAPGPPTSTACHRTGSSAASGKPSSAPARRRRASQGQHYPGHQRRPAEAELDSPAHRPAPHYGRREH